MKTTIQGAIHIGAIGIAVIGSLLAITYESDYDRSLRILSAAGAKLGNSGDPNNIVGARFFDCEIDEDIVKELLVHAEIFNLTFQDCRFRPGALRLMTNLQALEIFELTRCSIDSMAELESFFATVPLDTFRGEDVSLSDNQIHALVNPNLQTVSLRRCGGISTDAVVSLAKSPELENFSCFGVPIPIAEYRELVLHRPDFNISVAAEDIVEYKPYPDAGVRLVIDRQANVIAIDLDSAETAMPISSLRQFRDLKSLKIVGREIGSEFTAWLRELEKLQFLDLQGSSMETDALVNLSNASDLLYLNLDGVKTRSGGELELPPMPQLRHLQACSAAITETSFDNLNLESLTFLSLGPNVTPTILTLLTGLDHLNSFALYGTTIDENLGEMLGDFKSLAHLIVLDGVIEEGSVSGLTHSNKLASIRFIGTDVSPEVLFDIRRRSPNLFVEDRPMVINREFDANPA